jgi:hypothetical protein
MLLLKYMTSTENTKTEVQQGADHMKVGVATLPAGIYTINISNGRYIIGKKFSIMR